MPFEFTAEIMRLEGKIKWNVVYFPYPAAEHFGFNGNIPVRISVDGHGFDHMLLPSRNGHYLVVNEAIKRAVGKGRGDRVTVVLEKDAGKRDLVIPAWVEAALKEAGAWDAFLKRPRYFQRESINHIETAKKEETRMNRLAKLIERMAERDS